MFVADGSDNDRIYKFNSSGVLEKIFGGYGTGDGQFDTIWGMAIDSSGNIYASDWGNSRVQKFDNNGVFLMAWGSSGSGDGQFNVPAGIEINASGNVYVADSYNHRIQIFDSSGNFLSKYGSVGSADGAFNRPIDVAFDALGNIYICDYGNSRIQKFESDWTFTTKWGTSGSGNSQFNHAESLAIDQSGEFVYVSDRDNSRIQKFQLDGTFVTKWGTARGTSLLENTHLYPRGVTVDTSGNVYVANSAYFNVVKFDSSGTFLYKWGSMASDNGLFHNPIGVAVDSNKNIYVTDENNYRIQKFDKNGNFVTKWGSYGTGDGQFSTLVFDLTVDSQDNIYVMDRGNAKIIKFSSSGTFLTSWSFSSEIPTGIAYDAKENVFYAVSSSASVVHKLDISGNILSTFGSSGSEDGQMSTPYGIAVDKDSYVYVADTYNYRIQKFDKNGNFVTKWGSYGTGDGQFDSPYALSVDNYGFVYVADYGNHRVQQFDTSGNYLATIGERSYTDGNFEHPWGIESSVDGDLVVVDYLYNRIQFFEYEKTPPLSFELVSPQGYTKDDTKPTLVFKKAIDAESGMSSYTVSLDSGKNKTYSISGIPATGDITKSSYAWKDDEDVKVEFTNENDSDISNDEIKVFFKKLKSNELTEGKHNWRAIAYDAAGNSKEESTNFYIDHTNPAIDDLAIASVSAIVRGKVYKLNGNIKNQRTPSFSGKIIDIYKGSEKTYSDGTPKDIFDKVASGPEKITLTLKKLQKGENPNSAKPIYEDYLTKNYYFSDIKDDLDKEKYSRFYITSPFPLKDGYYQASLTLFDQTGNFYVYPNFYLFLNYHDYSFESLVIAAAAKEERISQSKTQLAQKEQVLAAETNKEKRGDNIGRKPWTFFILGLILFAIPLFIFFKKKR